NGFPGQVYGVHPTATAVHGVPCVPLLADLPEAPDAVVIATPAATVPGLVAEAGKRGAGGAVVFAAGFAEAPDGAVPGAVAPGAAVPGAAVPGAAVPGGRDLQERLRDAALTYG